MSTFVTDAVMKNANENYDVRDFQKVLQRVVHSRTVLLH